MDKIELKCYAIIDNYAEGWLKIPGVYEVRVIDHTLAESFLTDTPHIEVLTSRSDFIAPSTINEIPIVIVRVGYLYQFSNWICNLLDKWCNK